MYDEMQAAETPEERMEIFLRLYGGEAVDHLLGSQMMTQIMNTGRSPTEAIDHLMRGIPGPATFAAVRNLGVVDPTCCPGPGFFDADPEPAPRERVFTEDDNHYAPVFTNPHERVFTEHEKAVRKELSSAEVGAATCENAYTKEATEWQIQAHARYSEPFGYWSVLGPAYFLSIGYEAENTKTFEGDSAWEDAASYIEKQGMK